jgi:hypothetical protein
MIVRTASYIISNNWLAEPARSNYRQLRNRKRFYVQRCQLGLQKSLFQELNGFQGNDTIASGDDVFLLQKR